MHKKAHDLKEFKCSYEGCNAKFKRSGSLKYHKVIMKHASNVTNVGKIFRDYQVWLHIIDESMQQLSATVICVQPILKENQNCELTFKEDIHSREPTAKFAI
jgi:hypothetical protein